MMRPTHTQNGFTLVEMLVALVLLLILGAVYLHLLSMVNGGSGSGVAMRNKGRGIWIAIVSANSEREAIRQGPLWPHEARLPIEQGGAGLRFTTATDLNIELGAGVKAGLCRVG
jgi:prepilin-type N-terminal cleavage/methylation domain-containing protein